MLYFANPSTGPVRDAMISRRIGCIMTPAQGNTLPPSVTWCGDNGRFGQGWPGRDTYLRWAAQMAADIDRCQFMVAPDVPFDMAGTLAEFHTYCDDLHSLGYPVALALQNGAEHVTLPWGDIEAVFIGGDTTWKTGPAAAALAAEAAELGKHVHMGRVNSRKRFLLAAGMGCDSADGTFLVYGPNKNIVRLLNWADHYRTHGAQRVIA